MDEREGGTSQFVLSFEREGGDVASFDGAKIAHFPKERAIALKKKKKKKKTLATKTRDEKTKATHCFNSGTCTPMIDATFSVCSVIQNAEHDRERVANSCPNLSLKYHLRT